MLNKFLIFIVFLVFSCEETMSPKFSEELSVGCIISPFYKTQTLIVAHTTDVVDSSRNWCSHFDYKARASLISGSINSEFIQDTTARGEPVFKLVHSDFTISSGETYQLVVESGTNKIKGATTVPGEFKITSPLKNQEFEKGETINFSWTNSTGAQVYIVNLKGPRYFHHGPVDSTEANKQYLLKSDYSFDLHYTIEKTSIPFDSGKYTIMIMACDKNLKRHQFDEVHTSGITCGYGYFGSGTVDTLSFFIIE